MAKFTLDDIRAEAERRYGPTVIGLSDGTECVLQNILNLDAKTSRKVQETLEALQSRNDGEDQDVETLREAATTLLKLVAGGGGEKLAKELGGNIAETMIVIEHWAASTQVGEATPSGN